MSKFYLFIILLIFPFISYSQGPFLNISFEKALRKAAREDKLIFLQLELGDCIQCNDVANQAFSDKDLAAKISSDFIALKIPAQHPDRALIAELFDLKSKFGTLYIDKNKRLIHTTTFTTSMVEKYYKEMDIAYQKLAKYKAVEDDEKRYFQNGDKNISLLKNIIETKTERGLDNGLLLLELINLIPKDSLDAISTIQFIARQSPVLNSKPDSLIRRSKNFSAAWYDMPLNERIQINQQTINKSIQLAAEERNENLAKSIARFTAGTYTDPQEAQNGYDNILMRYYLHVKDTAQYLATGIEYYERYKNIYTDEKLEQMFKDALKNGFANAKEVKTYPGKNEERIKRFVTAIASPKSQVSGILNNAAWNFYNFDINKKYINYSVQWAKRSVEIEEKPNNLDTYARILYKLNRTEEAIKQEQKAIELSKKMGSEKKEWEEIIDKMKKGEAIQ